MHGIPQVEQWQEDGQSSRSDMPAVFKDVGSQRCHHVAEHRERIDPQDVAQIEDVRSGEYPAGGAQDRRQSRDGQREPRTRRPSEAQNDGRTNEQGVEVPKTASPNRGVKQRGSEPPAGRGDQSAA